MIICKISNFSYGYGIRYEYGIFTQKIKGTEQVDPIFSYFTFLFYTYFATKLDKISALQCSIDLIFHHRLKSLMTGCALEIPGRRYTL